MTTEPNFAPEVTFGRVNQMTSFEAYLIDGDTIRDLIAAVNPNTVTQAFRVSRIREILEEAKHENVVQKPNSLYVFGDE
jgi:hypothetical protein